MARRTKYPVQVKIELDYVTHKKLVKEAKRNGLTVEAEVSRIVHITLGIVRQPWADGESPADRFLDYKLRQGRERYGGQYHTKTNVCPNGPGNHFGVIE